MSINFKTEISASISKLREPMLGPIRKILEDSQSVLSIAHPFSDGDALGSQIALHRLCKSLGKRSVFLNFDPIPSSISWLGAKEAVSELPNEDFFDVIFLLETTDIQRMKDRSQFFERGKHRIHLDHHLGVTGLGHLNIIDSDASSVCEILFDIFAGMEIPFGPEILEPLYVGIMTDTGNFRFPNTTPRAHEIASFMIKAGVDVAKIFKQVYEKNSFSRILLHGLIMGRVTRHFSNRLAFSWLTPSDFENLGATSIDSDGAINHLCTIEGIEIALLIRELSDGVVKLSFRSTGKADVQQICRIFGGGGHKLAAAAQISGELSKVKQAVFDALTPIFENFDDSPSS